VQIQCASASGNEKKNQAIVWADFYVFSLISLCLPITANEAADDQSVSGRQNCWELRIFDL